MKLNRIYLLNSAGYTKADMLLDSSSIQIADGNNIGKSTLLRTLLYLFVVNGKKIVHEEYTSVESRGHYFPTQNTSYMIFEGFDEKHGYFYILLKRNEKKIEYYFSNKEFKEEYLLSTNEDENKVINFKDVLKNPSNGLSSIPLKSSSEVLAKVISSNKNNLCFLRLEEHTKNSVRFSDLYRHLFSLKNTEGDVLKNGILIALGYQDEKIDFGSENQNEQIIKFKRQNRDILSLREVGSQYQKIKEMKTKSEDNQFKLMNELTSGYEMMYESQIKTNQFVEDANIENDIFKKEQIQNNSDYEEVIKNDTKTKLKIEQLEEDINSIKKDLVLYESYGGKMWLQQEVKNCGDQISQITILLNKLEKEDKSSIENKIFINNTKIKQLQNMIDNNQDLLLNNITNNNEDLIIYNSILSDNVKHLHKNVIKHKTDNTDISNFQIGNAIIDISNIEKQKVKSMEILKQELTEFKEEQKSLQIMLININQRTKLETEFKILKQQEIKINEKIKSVEKISQLTIDLSIDEAKFRNYAKELSLIEKELIRVRNKKSELENNNITKILKEAKKTQQFINKTIIECLENINNYSIEKYSFNDKNLNTNCTIELTLNYMEDIEQKIISKDKNITELIRNFETSRINYDNSIDVAKGILKGTDANRINNNEEFLKWLDNNTYKLNDQEETLTKLGKGIENLFILRNKNILDKLREVRTYINNTINGSLDKYKISNLSNIKIKLETNDKIINLLDTASKGKIDLLDFLTDSETELIGDKKTIADYVRQGKSINLHELFNIKLELNLNDTIKRTKQSNGTEKMLRVMILLILIREMIHKKDYIPYMLDEIVDIDDKNQRELIKFSKLNRLIPISASTVISPNFDKIYGVEQDKNNFSYLSEKTCIKKVSLIEVYNEPK